MKSVLDVIEELVKSLFKSKCVAPLENGDTISRTYYAGNNFIRDGVLYKAKQTISVNTAWSTLVLNTHYEEDISIISKLAGKAPTNHASPDTTYGVGSTTDYGHVKVDSVLSDSSTNPVQNSIITLQIQALANSKADKADEVLFFKDVAVSATTGQILSKSDSKITADHVLVECVFANPSAITTDVTWETTSGNIVFKNATCTSATTATITLAKKGN